MAGQTFYDVAHGKPIQANILPIGEQQYTVDLLWSYRFDWVVFDRWSNSAQDVPEQNSEVSNPIRLLQYSTDGTNFTDVSVEKVLVVSNKGSQGTHRSLQLLFKSAISARYFRYVCGNDPWKYKLRASVRTTAVSAMEGAKKVEPISTPNQDMMQDRPIRAAVLGCSNSVMRYGWVKGLVNGGVRVTENASLGSSSNAIFASRLPLIRDSTIDSILISSNVNEYFPIRDRMYDTDLSRQFVRHVQAWCSRKNVIPIYLIYPHRRVLDDVIPFDQEAYFIELCEDLHIPYINGFEIERRLAQAWNRPRTSFYKDEAHLNHATAQVLGTAVGAAAWNFIRGSLKGTSLWLDNELKTHDFDILSLQNSDQESDSRKIETSLVKGEFTTIRATASINVPILQGWEVVGYTANARRCNASIKLVGENSVTRRLDFAGYQGPDGYPFVCSRSLINPVTPSNGTVTIQCVSPAAFHEPDEISQPDAQRIPLEEREIELQHLIVRKKNRTEPYLRIKGTELDLLSRVSLSFATN